MCYLLAQFVSELYFFNFQINVIAKTKVFESCGWAQKKHIEFLYLDLMNFSSYVKFKKTFKKNQKSKVWHQNHELFFMAQIVEKKSNNHLSGIVRGGFIKNEFFNKEKRRIHYFLPCIECSRTSLPQN